MREGGEGIGSERKSWREGREEAGSTDKASPPPSLGPASLAFFEWVLRALQRHDATGGEEEDEACAAML